jgi:hypothetical protein
MKKFILLTFIVLAASCAKKDDTKNANDTNVDDQASPITTKSYTSDCTTASVEERTNDAGKVTKYERTMKQKYGYSVTRDKATPDTSKRKSAGEVEISTVKTTPDGKTENTKGLKYSFDKERTLTTTAMADDKFKDVDVQKMHKVAKEGYDFGEKDGKKITETTSNHTYEVVYQIKDDITAMLSIKVDGKDETPDPERYKHEEKMESDYILTTDTLVEPVTYPDDKTIKLVSEVTTCKVKQVVLN